MEKTRQFIESLGFASRDLHELPSSTKRFPDGAAYRMEVPSCEGPRCLAAIVEESERLGVTIHRVSQGSGIMMQTDAEIREMLAIAHSRQMEVSLFTGPRGTWDISAGPLTASGKFAGARHEGMDQLVSAFADIRRGCELGLRSILAVDEGLIFLVGKARQQGILPADLIVKVSVQLAATNPVSVRMLEQAGANTYNVPPAMSLARLAALRAAVDMPFDVYIEAPEDFGGFVRYYDIPEIIRVLAPVYLKMGIRNHPGIYPSGGHLDDLAVKLSRERVRRAVLAREVIDRHCPEAVMSKPGALGLGIPAL